MVVLGGGAVSYERGTHVGRSTAKQLRDHAHLMVDLFRRGGPPEGGVAAFRAPEGGIAVPESFLGRGRARPCRQREG